jgi:subtilisin family serine protease
VRVGWVAGSVVVLAALCSCAPDDPTLGRWPEFAPRSAAPPRLPAGPLDHLELVVKFDDTLEVRSPRPDALLARSGSDLANVEAIRDRYGLRFTPLLRVAEPRIEQLRARAQARSGRRQPDLMSAMRVDVRDATPELLVEVATALQRLPEVDLAYVHSTRTPPPVDLDPTTPALDLLQGYRGADGIDADTAAAMGFDGAGIHIADVEQNWDFEHEDLVDAAFDLEPGVIIWPEHDDPNHGTSVVGTLIAPNNGYGITGMTPGATLTGYPEIIDEGYYRRADAIASAAAGSNPGDVILLEIQETEPVLGNYAPGEIEDLVWMITRMATDAGIVVVAAAGNGNIDLDAPELQYYRDRGDSGAIIVGAGVPSLRDKLDFSTYGARVDVQGWGVQVFTTGYGNYAMYGGDTRQAYTATFSGTSSASPIVTAAAVLVQQAAIANLGAPLTSQQIRSVLIGTGLPQGAGGHIGPLPQVPAAIAAASTPDISAPAVTIITPSDDVAVEESSFQTSIEIDAQDDSGFVAHVQLQIAGELQPVFDEIEPWAFEDVNFPVGTFEIIAVATDVWGNVGESAPLTISVGVEPTLPSSGDVASSSGDESTTAPEPPSASTTGDEDDDGESTGDPGATPRTDEGCGCRTRSAPHAAWLFVLAFAIRRRSKSVSA